MKKSYGMKKNYFIDRRIDRETNSKTILYISKSIDEYTLQEINWRANK